MDRAELEDLVIRFTDAFNRDDLDGRGLDILHVETGLVTRKLTSAKTKVPLIESPPAPRPAAGPCG